MTPEAPAAATRTWRLRGFAGKAKTDKPVIESTCRGDRALDEAMARLERDNRITRITVEPQ